MGDAGDFQPLQVGRDRAQRLEGRGAVLHAKGFAVAFAARQEQGDADTGLGLDVLYAQAGQFIPTETAPEAQQQ